MAIFSKKRLIFAFLLLSQIFFFSKNSFSAQPSICELENNNELTSATALPLDKYASGTINPLKDIDYYKINVTAAGLLSISLTNVSNQIEAFISIFNKDGLRLVTKFSDARGMNINLERMLSEGDYYICVGDTPGKHISLVPYLLKANFSPAISFNCGEIVQGSISVKGEKDIYTLTASANDKVTIRATATSGYLDAYLELYAPDGTNLAKARGQID
ncbi:MAG: hypothetical protein NC826_06475, partial [Candidatus Omnitrophica bacterium]|nr:hypothetical protein [Candidatus Omnitrophota bacterium]